MPIKTAMILLRAGFAKKAEALAAPTKS